MTLLLLSIHPSNPTGFITKPATVVGTKPAPFMAAFSSQGPNIITPEILKVRSCSKAFGLTDPSLNDRREPHLLQ